MLLIVDEMISSPSLHVLLTSRILSAESSFFRFRINRASSSVMRCSRVSLSVSDPDVAFDTPATSLPIALAGVLLASASQ